MVLTPALTIVNTANAASRFPVRPCPRVVSYTVTVTDTGQTPYTGARVTDQLAGVLDDAVYNGDACVTGPAPRQPVSFSSPDLTWTGDLAPGPRRRSRSRSR